MLNESARYRVTANGLYGVAQPWDQICRGVVEPDAFWFGKWV